MKISQAEKRQVENEMIFRRMNENISHELDTLNEIHAVTGDQDLILDEDLQLQFKCECSDENCSQRIPLSVSHYKRIHQHRDRFIVRPGHQVDAIEEVIDSESEYSVVLKKVRIPEPDNTLNKTAVDNT